MRLSRAAFLLVKWLLIALYIGGSMWWAFNAPLFP
jgi:hypothetical protein